MKASHLAVVTIAAVWTIGCAHALERPLDAPRATRSTYFILDGHSSGIPAIDRRLQAEIEKALADRGMLETAPGEGDAVVVFHTATPGTLSHDALYRGWGGWVWSVPGTGTTDRSETYKVGTLVVDMFDAWTKKLVWHGYATNAVSGRDANSLNTHAMENAVTRLFQNFVSGSGQTDDGSGVQTGPANQTMNIMFSSSPALLVRIDGEPRYEDVTGTRLQRITNTAALIVRDDSGIFHFRLGETWMEAYELTGSWSVTGGLPDGADLARRQASRQRAIDLERFQQLKANT